MNQQQLTFDPPEKREGKLIFELRVPGRLPSWNELLGMQHWSRHKLKGGVQKDFLFALRVSERTCSMRTTSAKSITSIASVMLESYLAMIREKRILKSASKNPIPERPKKSSSKFFKSKVPF